MKIDRIILNNLNSLRGKHTIDLTVEPLSTAGLFAITGPTGAGKSTLLDAITLALYGRAARYGRRPNPEDMMSRRCGECSAEVEFEVPAGKYRAVWQLRRAKGSAAGKVQAPRRYIYDMDGVTLATQVRECDEKILDLIGLDYDRFVRSVMLAQGEFARFLKAGADERAELLECLTGTEIYSDLSILAHKEATRCENELTLKQQLLDQIEILEDEERREVEDHVTKLKRDRSVVEKDLSEKSAIATSVDKLVSALTRRKEINGRLNHLEASQKDAEPDLKLLTRHRETVPFQADIIQLQSAEYAAQNSREKRQVTQDEREERYVQYQQARLDYYKTLKNEIAEQESTIQDAKARARKADKTSIPEREWLEAHRIDADLSAHIADLAANLTDLRSKRATLLRELEQVSNTASVVESGVKEPVSLENTRGEALSAILSAIEERLSEEHKNAKDARTSAEKDLSRRKDHLQKARLIANYDTHRASLEKGEPCPLCGATEHPYSDGDEPSFAFEELELEVARAEEMRNRQTDRVSKLADAIGKLTSQQTVVTRARQDLTEYEAELLRRLRVFEVALPEEGKEEETRKSLQKREKAYLTHRRNLHDIEEAATRAKEDEYKAQDLLEKRTRDLQQLDAFDAEDVGDIVERLSVEEARQDWSDKKTKLEIQVAELRAQLSNEEAARKSLTEIQERLMSAIDSSDFQDLDDLRAANLDQEEAHRIEQIEVDFKNRKHDLTTRLEVAKEEIEFLREAGIPEGEEAEHFKAEYEKSQNDRDILIEKLTTQQNRVEMDDKNRRKFADQKELLDKAQKDAAIWGRLRLLIGSHDGAKFRKYAQSISLDVLIRHANRHLSRLSDRYRIQRISGEELQLEIEDLHQAGVTRPMASLSGGESFLASLALALGLSELAGRNVRIDSLFIDEGFGSLDSDVLDLAIGTLEALHQHNKSVGVISHVELLKQRITTQIQVIKQTAGDSVLEIV